MPPPLITCRVITGRGTTTLWVGGKGQKGQVISQHLKKSGQEFQLVRIERLGQLDRDQGG